MEQHETQLLEEGNYELYIHDTKEKLGFSRPYIRVSLSKYRSAAPVCSIYLPSGRNAENTWGKTLKEYGEKAQLPKPYYAEVMPIVDFIQALKDRNVKLNVSVKHRTCENQTYVDARLERA